MKKKLLLFALAAIMAATLILASCGSADLDRGEWNGNVFTNEFFGLTFNMPNDWLAASDAEIADLLGIGSEVFEFDDLMEDEDLVIAMLASSPDPSGSNVNLGIGRLPRRNMSSSAFMNANLTPLREMGADVRVVPGTVRIGGNDWYKYSYSIVMFGTLVTGYGLARATSGYGAIITVTVSEGSATLAEILDMFE